MKNRIIVAIEYWNPADATSAEVIAVLQRVFDTKDTVELDMLCDALCDMEIKLSEFVIEKGN